LFRVEAVWREVSFDQANQTSVDSAAIVWVIFCSCANWHKGCDGMEGLFMKRASIVAAVAMAALTLAGCAATATGTKVSAMTTSSVPVPLEAKAPDGSTLVVVRYPAMVETDARDIYYDAYLNHAIDGKLSKRASDNPDAMNIADSTIIKSNYFALSLYKELAQRLPDHSVLLSPHAVSLDNDGALTSKPMTGAESVATVLTVDFSTYSFPDPDRMMKGEPLTFGDLITPLIVVHTDHRAAAPTRGVLLSSNDLMGHAAGSAERDIKGFLAAMQSGQLEVEPAKLHFISYITGEQTGQLKTSPLSLAGPENVAQSYPLEKVVLDRAALSQLNAEDAGNVDPLANVFSSGLADRIVDLLNDVDTNKAAMMSRAAAVSNFDPNLGALSLVGMEDPDYQSRIRYAERLLDAERKYLSVQSLRMYDGIHNGEVGVQMRDLLSAERDVLDQRRKLAQQQNMATAAAIASVVAAGVAVSESGNNVSMSEYILADALRSAAILATSKAIMLNRESKAVGANYLASIVPALEEQTSVQVNLIESNETITAIRFEDLREKLQTLYAEKQRAVDTIATSCGYSHDGADLIGKWQGVCADGRAAGPGVGVVQYDDGRAFEYFGEAKNGQPHGTGYLIEHTSSGSTAIEGNFASGKPDGIVMLSAAGVPDQLRIYKNGVDTGAAPSGAIAPTLFSASSDETG
jgi:hypothetical protein